MGHRGRGRSERSVAGLCKLLHLTMGQFNGPILTGMSGASRARGLQRTMCIVSTSRCFPTSAFMSPSWYCRLPAPTSCSAQLRTSRLSAMYCFAAGPRADAARRWPPRWGGSSYTFVTLYRYAIALVYMMVLCRLYITLPLYLSIPA